MSAPGSFGLAYVVPRRLRLGLFDCTLGRVALLVLAPAPCLLAPQLSRAVGFRTPALFLLALALTSPFVVGVAVGVGGAPAFASVVDDCPQLAQHTHRFAPQRNTREESHMGHSAARLVTSEPLKECVRRLSRLGTRTA